MRQKYAAFFVQDDWRASNHLSMQAGLRYDFVTDPKELNGKVAGLLSLDDLESRPDGITPGTPMFKNPSKKSFAPRLGVGLESVRRQEDDGQGRLRPVLPAADDLVLSRHDVPDLSVLRRRRHPPARRVRPGQHRACSRPASTPRSCRSDPSSSSTTTKQPYMEQWHANVERDLGHQHGRGDRLHRIEGAQPAVLRRPEHDVPSAVRRRRRQAAGARRDAAVSELGPHPHAHQRGAGPSITGSRPAEQALLARLAGAGLLHLRQLARHVVGRTDRRRRTSTTAPAAPPTGGIPKPSTVRRASTSGTRSW